MRYLEYVKIYRNFDDFLLFLDDLGFSADEIATMTGSSRQSIYNAKDRQQWLIGALKLVTSDNKQYGNPEINAIVTAFKEYYQTTKVTKYDRWAAKRLGDKHGSDNVITIIKVLSTAHDQYRPIINSVSQLEEKWASVENFLRNKSDNKAINPNE